MSRSIGKQSLLQTLAKRNYSAQSALKPNAGDVNVDVTTKGIRVVTCNVDSPLPKISFSFKAGSRFENASNLGVNHILRKAVGLSTTEVFPFNIQRNSQQYGLNLYGSTDRETYTVTVEANSHAVSAALFYINSIATKPAFKPWEINDNRERIKLELLLAPPEAKTLDALHQAAYRNGLGNPLYVDPTSVSKISNVDVAHFYTEHCTSSRLQITASGIRMEELSEFLPNVEAETGKGPQDIKATYYGGERRIVNADEFNVYYALAGETPGYTKKEYLPYAILKHVYGNPPPTKYGFGQGILNKALSSTGALGVLTGFNSTFSDSGLVGFFLAVEKSGAVKAIETVVSTLFKSNISDKDVARGKALLKTSIAENVEGGKLVDFFSRQVGVENLITPQQILSAIDSVTTADVKQAAQKIASSKLSVAAYGNINAVPYLDTLKK